MLYCWAASLIWPRRFSYWVLINMAHRSPALVEQSTNVNNWEKNGTTFEYGSAANPVRA